ncbi:MAG: hypothetical protein ACFFG0_04290 [Candidatus Thorarchaeota archaeon]
MIKKSIWRLNPKEIVDEFKKGVNRFFGKEFPSVLSIQIFISVWNDRINNLRELSQHIPSFNFPSDWKVKIIPPFMGAICRFKVRKNEKEISIYLDFYDILGSYGCPYWEVYPNVLGDNSRFDLNDTKGVINCIKESLDKHNDSKN